ncbi:hypothetical protein [Pseudomonas caspiana]|uniref:Uncharacterized protein n=1 Tax=Pseudomonas caspiana TaxID=1451454 RepID=A0A1Y3P683_9PSED|nr:hypothetical protein [Pseudomonas caspiana]OUM75327.1 hypothetical protein AUC60_03770 [Pseudomonas caspiana]
MMEPRRNRLRGNAYSMRVPRKEKLIWLNELGCERDPVGTDEQREAAIAICLINRHRSLALLVSPYR